MPPPPEPNGDPHPQRLEAREFGERGDDELMQLVARGDHTAFAALVERHHAVIWGFASRFLGCREAGYEVAQEVFLSLWAERGRYEARGRLRSYLLTLAFHRASIVARKTRHDDKKRDSFARTLAVCCPEEQRCELTAEAATRDRVQASLSGLSPVARRVLVLRFFNELSLEEIAAATNMPLGTVKSHLWRALRRLRSEMGEVQR